MSWFDNLKTLAEAHTSFFNSAASTLKFNSDNKHITNNITFHLNIPQPNASESKETAKILSELKSILQDGIKEEAQHTLTTGISDEKLKLITEVSSEAGGINSEHLEFVSNHLPSKDRGLWTSALILRSKSEQRDTAAVKSIKLDLISHSDRGKNIANLCSAGYLESEIMPLYDYLVNQVGDENQFQLIYEQIVTEFPRAIFVSSLNSMNEVETEIRKKIGILISAGWSVLNIHAYGEDNVRKSIDALNSYQQKRESKKISILLKPPRPTHHVLITVTITK